ncbi:MAG: hypothetical protein GVX78_02260 [Bacteroidetes bacterium]|jgi:hypothetical protein|nr:hypothetical protein [Bacteroidota bacterium]
MIKNIGHGKVLWNVATISLIFFTINFAFQSSDVKAENNGIYSAAIDTSKIDSILLIQSTDHTNIEFMESHIQMIQEDLSEIELQIQNLKEKYESLSQLIPKEQILFSQVQTLKMMFTNADNRSDFNSFHEQISESILEFSNEKIKTYQTLSLSSKLEGIAHYIQCYDALLKVYPAYSDFASELEFLEEAFTRKVLNPYTMTDMDERRKKIIFERFMDLVFPFVLEDLGQNVNCENVDKKLENLSIVRKKLLQLRDQETDELEDALRDETDALSIINLLELDLDLE